MRQLLRDATESGSRDREAAAGTIAGMVSNLVEARQFLVNILESSTEYSIIAKDLQRNILSWNAGARRNYGYEPGEVLGRSSDLLHDPTELKGGLVQRLHEEALRTGHAEGKFLRRRKDGTTFLASVVITRREDEKGNPVGYLLISRDVTRDEAVRREADEYRRLLDNIMQSSTQYSIIASDLGRRIQTWNAGAQRNYGYGPDEVLGKSSDLLHAPTDLESGIVDRMHREALEQGHAEGTFHRQRKDGSRFTASVVITRREDHKGRPIGYLLISRDITEEQRLREEAEQRLRQLVEADRRKDEFLATLAHELRNPLAPIAMAIEVLRRGLDRGNQQAYHQIIDRQAGHLTRLVDDLLDVARISRGKIDLRREPVSLMVALRQGAEVARPLFDEKRHSFEIRGDERNLWLDADPVRLAQVFGNLLRNAAKFTPVGGSIEASVRAEGDEAVVDIKDSGVGIPPDRLTDVFEAFVQVHAEQGGGGLGIGLTLVKRIVELHGGTVRARSAGKGQGSTFTVRLPLVVAPAGPSGASAPPQKVGPQRVLVIDDNPDVGETLATLLRLEGHTVDIATSGPQGLVRARSLLPTVVFCDIGMPGMSGYEVAQEMRRDPGLRSCRLVALTGYAQSGDETRARAAGFDLHLPKPAARSDILAALAPQGKAEPGG